MIDMLASEVQFVDHLAPIWLALPLDVRGEFMAHRSVRGRVTDWGIPAMGEDTHDRPILVASFGDHKRARRQGRKSIARMEHGAGQSYFGDSRFGGNPSYAGGKGCHDVSLFLCPNDYSAERWQESYPGARVEVVGCPKLDHLPAREPGPLTVAVSFHFDINIIPETRSAFPAYRNALPELARRYKVIAHGHPKGLGFIERYYRRMDIEVVADFAEVCRRADVYAVDNSSTLFEFASTGRPVVVLNDPGFRRDVHHGLRFWSASTVGINVNNPADLVAAVERALVDPPEQRAAREAALDIAYAYRTGAAERAAAALMSWAGVDQAVAA